MDSILSKQLPIMEAFYTIQGEGFQSGKPAYFIRLGGCDVGCHWCDVKESWEASKHPSIDLGTILNGALAHPSRFIVVTGGEPLMYNLTDVCALLIDNQFELAIETSGAYPFSGEWHWFCLSPKKNKPPLTENYHHANELKVIIYNKSDFKWAEEHAAKVSEDCKLYLQVEWSKRQQLTPLIIEYIKNNPKWNISVQTHKFLDIP